MDVAQYKKIAQYLKSSLLLKFYFGLCNHYISLRTVLYQIYITVEQKYIFI
jgi:hypothetical protein